MKFAILLSLFLGAAALADVTGVNVAKSADGKTIVCESQSDLNKSGYRPAITTVIPDGDKLNMNTAIVNVICSQKDGKLAFDVRHLYDAIPGVDLNGHVMLEYLDQVQFLVVDRKDRVLGQIDGTNDFMQALSYAIPVSRAFSKQELASIDKGQTLHIRWEFFMQGTHTIQQGLTKTPLGLFTGGSYYVSFDISKTSAGLSVKNVTLN